MHVWAGPPVDLDDLRGRPVDADVLREATDRIMAALVAIVAEQRGETAARRAVRPQGRRAARDRPVRRARPTGPAGPRGAVSRDRVTVLGSGSWGTTFAAVTADAGCPATVWGRDAAVVAEIDGEHRNSAYLPGIDLPASLRATTDAEAAVAEADVLVLALPSKVLRGTLGPLAGAIPPGAVLVSLSKGVELGTNRRMSEVVAEAAGVDAARVAVVSGPNLAREIAEKQPTATVVAAPGEEVADRVAAACSTDYFRPYTNNDVVGVEIAGAMKNVIALAVGMAVGMGMGDNSKASLITRGLAETARLGAALGADPLTFSGPGRDGRPRRDVHLAAEPQPHLRRAARRRAAASRRSWPRPGRPPRASCRAARCSRWPARSASTCPSPRPWPPWSTGRAPPAGARGA